MLVNRIITKRVLNEETGELESKDFAEIITKTKMAGGFNLLYINKYQEVMSKVCVGKTSTAVLIWVQSSFTARQTEVNLSFLEAKKYIPKLSKGKYFQVLHQLLEIGFIKKIKIGRYRMNPYIYLPYKADGVQLQKEWNELEKQND